MTFFNTNFALLNKHQRIGAMNTCVQKLPRAEEATVKDMVQEVFHAMWYAAEAMGPQQHPKWAELAEGPQDLSKFWVLVGVLKDANYPEVEMMLLDAVESNELLAQALPSLE